MSLEKMVAEGNLAGLRQNRQELMKELNNPRCLLLHIASEFGHVDIAEYLLGAGANILQEDSCPGCSDTGDEGCGGYTPLHFARSEDMAAFLLDHGATANMIAMQGFAPLHCASSATITPVVRVLLEEKIVDVDCLSAEKTFYGGWRGYVSYLPKETPLVLALGNFVSEKIKWGICRSTGWADRHMWVRDIDPARLENHFPRKDFDSLLETVELLLIQGANPNHECYVYNYDYHDESHYLVAHTPLDYAYQCGNELEQEQFYDLLDLLISHGADPGLLLRRTIEDYTNKLKTDDFNNGIRAHIVANHLDRLIESSLIVYFLQLAAAREDIGFLRLILERDGSLVDEHRYEVEPSRKRWMNGIDPYQGKSKNLFGTPLAYSKNVRVAKILVDDFNANPELGLLNVQKFDIAEYLLSLIEYREIFYEAWNNKPLHHQLHRITEEMSYEGIKITKLLVNHNANVETLDEKRKYPLTMLVDAVEGGNWEMPNELYELISLFLKKNANPNFLPPVGSSEVLYTPFHSCIRTLEKRLIQLFCKFDPDLACHALVLEDELSTDFCNNSQDFDVTDYEEGATPLQEFFSYLPHTKERLRLINLLKKGTNWDIAVTMRDPQGNTPLYYAIYSFPEIALFIFKQGMYDLSVLNDQGCSLLHTPAEFPHIYWDTNFEYWTYPSEAVFDILRQSIHVDTRDCLGQTPLHKVKHRKYAEMLLSEHASLEVRDNNERTPIHCVSDPDTLRFLLSKGVSIDAHDKNGDSPLWFHLWKFLKTFDLYHYEDEKRCECIEALLLKGANDTLELRYCVWNTDRFSGGNYDWVYFWSRKDERNEFYRSREDLSLKGSTPFLLIILALFDYAAEADYVYDTSSHLRLYKVFAEHPRNWTCVDRFLAGKAEIETRCNNENCKYFQEALAFSRDLHTLFRNRGA